MKRTLVTAFALVMLMALAVPAAATETTSGGAVATCRGLYETREQEIPPGSGNVVEQTAYWVPLQYPEGPAEDLPIQTLLGCVTTLRNGGGSLPVPYTALSIPAINGQCRYLEEEEGLTYPYDFYGNPEYHAENRLDCVYYLRAFHLGVLPPGGGPE